MARKHMPCDFCLLLNQQRIPVFYAPTLLLLHEGGASSGGEFSAGYSKLFWRSYMQSLRKHFGMVEAVRTCARVLFKEAGRAGQTRAVTLRMAGAMSPGLLAPVRRTQGLG